MMFLGVVTLRGEEAPDLTLGGVTAASLFILLSRDFGEDPVLGGFVRALSLLVALGVSFAGSRAYTLWEARAQIFSAYALSRIARGNRAAASAVHLVTVIMHFVFGFAVLFAVLTVVRFLLSLFLAAVVREGSSLDMIYLVIPFIGVGSLVRSYFKRAHIFWFAAGFLVAYMLFLTRG
jgi:mannose/fructose/N-acetylgalactosamine-specific phosphotransferase system component IIC